MNGETLQDRVAAIRERIAAAAKRCGRSEDQITLIAVSKTHTADAIVEAIAAGVRHFGENRVQEWEGKRGALGGTEGQWHLIGHLQSNKAGKAARFFHCVDSVDDFALAQKLDRAKLEIGDPQRLRVLIEVRIAPEETKNGVAPTDLALLAEKVFSLERLELAGLMCIPPFLENPEEVRPHFSKLRELRDDLQRRMGKALPVLSMGMSHDFEIAVEEGATEVRVGTALFGTRSAPPHLTL